MLNKNSKIEINSIILEIFIFIWLDILLFDLSPSLRIFYSTLIAKGISRTIFYLLKENLNSLENTVKKDKLNSWILFIVKIFSSYFLVYKISTSLEISDFIIKLIIDPILGIILYEKIDITDKSEKLIFRIFRFIVKCLTKTHYIYPRVRSNEPTAYIIHNETLRGLVLSLAWFNTSMRPLLFGTRDNMKIFKESVSTLILGENILICPDINYSQTSSDMEQIYVRFLNLEKYYIQETGNHLAFVPLHINKERCHIYAGNAIYFNKTDTFEEEKNNVYTRLKEELSRIEKL